MIHILAFPYAQKTKIKVVEIPSQRKLLSGLMTKDYTYMI